jgi:acetyltransferase-like isoleucine patch superfamily enzyme
MNAREVFAKLMSIFVNERKVPTKAMVGRGVFIGNNVFIDTFLDGCLISIDDGCILTDGVMILSHDSSSLKRIGMTYCNRVKVGKRVFIGMRSIVLPGVEIGDDAIIAAGSIVVKDVLPGEIVAGSPARRIGLVEDIDARRVAMSQTRMIDISTRKLGLTKDPYNLEDDILTAAMKLKEAGGFMVKR